MNGAKLPQLVSSVAPLGAALNGAKRPVERKPRSKPGPTNGVIESAWVCPFCGERFKSLKDFHPHLFAKVMELQERADAGYDLADLITVAQAVKLVPVSYRTIAKYCGRGILATAVRLSRGWLVGREEITSYDWSDAIAHAEKHRAGRASAEEKEFLREAHGQMTRAEIAEALGRTEHWVEDQRYRLRDREGNKVCPPLRITKRTPPEVVVEILRLRDSGLLIAQIATRTQTPESTVRKILDRGGRTKRRSRVPAATARVEVDG